MAVHVPPALAGSEQRIEGRAKVTGAAAYVADQIPTDSLWMALLRSPVPHAIVGRVDVEAAREMPGVQAILTGADARGLRFGRRLQDWPILADDRVRFVGDRVAAIAASSPAEAAAAAGAISVDYDELPAVLTPRQALEPGAPTIHPDAGGYTFLGGVRPGVAHANMQGHQVFAKGEPDIEAALAAAPRRFEHRFTTARQHHGYIEPHATSVWIDDDIVHVLTTNKAPFSLRSQMAAALGLQVERIEVDSGYIGGDFGGKGLSLDECACYLLARATGRRVSAVMTYADELQSANPRHGAEITLRSGVDDRGRIVAHAASFLFDGGAYAAGKPMPALTPPGPLSILAAYDVPSMRVETTVAYTNTMPAGHMRGPGEVQAAFAGESHVDMIATALGLHPVDFRRRNAAGPGTTDVVGRAIREPRTIELLDALAGATAAHRPPDAPHGRSGRRGRGVSVIARHMEGGRMTIRLRLLPSGRIELLTGIPDQGGGAHTMMARVAAAVLGVAAERIEVIRETTAAGPVDLGVGASRVTYIGSRAVEAAAAALRARLVALARDRSGVPDVDLVDGRFVGPDGQPVVAFDDVAARLGEPVEVEGSYDSEVRRDEPQDFSFSAFSIEVEVDERTGVVQVVDALAALDVGTVINPIGHRGQIEGGFAFGIGAALLEELGFDEGRVTTVHLGDYKLPTMLDVPPLRTVEVHSTGGGAFGSKMAGELTVSGVAPAIANAIADATGRRVTAIPMTAERVLAAGPTSPEVGAIRSAR